MSVDLYLYNSIKLMRIDTRVWNENTVTYEIINVLRLNLINTYFTLRMKRTNATRQWEYFDKHLVRVGATMHSLLYERCYNNQENKIKVIFALNEILLSNLLDLNNDVISHIKNILCDT